MKHLVMIHQNSAIYILLGFALSLIPCTVSAGKDSADRPNILFIFSDDHAVQAIGAYGSQLNKTPNIDRIADEGALFLNNFCANSICAPSRATILTGKHSHKNLHLTNRDTFDGSQQTLPKLLRKVGYKTAIFGKWHLKSEPTGFDEWAVYPGQGNYYNPDYRTPDGMKRITGYSVEVTTDMALDFMKRQAGADEPFLLMCQYKAPHRNWNPKIEETEKFEGVIFPEPVTLFDDYSNRASPAANHKMGIDEHMTMARDLKVPVEESGDWDRMTPEQRAEFRKIYEADNAAFMAANLKGKDLVRWKYQRYLRDYLSCVGAVDTNIGRLLEYLDEAGLAENTLVIYSSDQGFYLGEHGWFDKRWMYEESFRMPLMMRWPGRIAAGTKIKQLTQNIDFAPTFLEVAGEGIPVDMQGASLIELCGTEEAVDWRNSLYYHYYESFTGHNVAKHYGVLMDHYKLIHYYETDEWELMDLEADPLEIHSFYGDPRYVEIQQKLEKELARLRLLYDVPDDNMASALPE